MEKVKRIAWWAVLAAAMCLAGCTPPGTTKLAPIPADLTICFNSLTKAPVKGPISRAAIVDLVARLKRSELAKSQCGRQLIDFYNTQRG